MQQSFSSPKKNKEIQGETINPSRIFSVPKGVSYLDTTQLAELERSFRKWADAPSREDVRASRQRILLIFLLIRYTGARLHEILALDDFSRIDLEKLTICLGNPQGKDEFREVEIPAQLGEELKNVLQDPGLSPWKETLFRIDPGHVRRKFYERAEACGLPRECGTPSSLRRSRSIELLQNNLPLPVVQKMLGHSTPSLTASILHFSDEDMHQVVRHYIDRESWKKTSARNIFFGKIKTITKGDIQSEVELVTVGGFSLISVITNGSMKHLDLKPNTFVTAEIKAPWVMLATGREAPMNSAANKLQGIVSGISRGAVNAEISLRLSDGTELCSVITEKSRKVLNLKEQDTAWALFDAYSVILNVE